MVKLDAKQLRKSVGDPIAYGKLPKNPLYIIVDNVLDT